MNAQQIFKFILCLIGIGVLVLDILFFDRNYWIGAIGGLIILTSGVHITFLIYHKDKDPEEIITKIKEFVRKE